MVGRPSSQSNTRRWHRLVEHHTPDGALGRVLLAAGSGSVSLLFFYATVASLVGGNPLSLLLSPLWGGFCLGTAVLAVVTLWPVYLSLIGNVESAKEYPRGASSRSRRSSSPPDEPDETDPTEVLKREYAAGNVSESEFERRLDILLRADDRLQNERTRPSRDAEDARETGTN